MDVNVAFVTSAAAILTALNQAVKQIPPVKARPWIVPIVAIVLGAGLGVADVFAGVSGATHVLAGVLNGLGAGLASVGLYEVGLKHVSKATAAGLLAGAAVLLGGCSLAGAERLPVFAAGGQLIEGLDDVQERLLETTDQKLALEAELAQRDLAAALARFRERDGKLLIGESDLEALMADYSNGVAARARQRADLARQARRIRARTRAFVGASAGAEASLTAERRATAQREALTGAALGVLFGRYGDLD